MNKNEVRTVKDLEEYYSNCRKIKFKDYIPETLEDTFHAISAGESTTFTKGGYQCKSNRARSIDDCIKIAKFYFPEKSVKEIVTMINNNLNLENYILVKNNSQYKYVRLGYCSTIRKSNLFKTPYPTRKEYNNLDDKLLYNSGFSRANFKFKDL